MVLSFKPLLVQPKAVILEGRLSAKRGLLEIKPSFAHHVSEAGL